MIRRAARRRVVEPVAAKKSNSAKRLALDAYYTPPWVVRLCMEHVLPKVIDAPYPSTVIEPGCGSGVFVQGLRDAYGDAPLILGVDLNPKVLPCPGVNASLCCDYLAAPRGAMLEALDSSGGLVEFRLALGNPPYSLAEAFVRRSFLLAEYTVFLLRQGFLSSAKRSELFREFPPLLVANLANRPSFTGGSGDKADYCFVAWRRGWGGATRLLWLPTAPLEERKA